MTAFELPKLNPWRGPTAPPPHLRWTDPTTTALWREHLINTHALFELTGIPTLYRWGRAIWERRPIHEIEKEYYEPIFRQLQEVGAAVPRLPRLEAPQPRGIIPADYVAEGARKPPPTVPDKASAIIAPDLPEDLKRRLRAMGVPASADDVAERVAGRSLVLALTAVPGFAGMTKEAARQLASIAAVGFGVPGAGAAATRTVQGFPEEAPRAFLEVGLASTVVGDIANIMRALPGMIRSGRVPVDGALKGARDNLPARSPEADRFMRELEDAVMRLKRGDTSRYDELLRQLDDWQKKLQEFEYLSVLKKAEALPPGQERRFYELMNEVDKIRDKYGVLKAFIDEVRSAGIEERGRWVAEYNRFTDWRTTVSDLARAAAEAPPGPVRDAFKVLSEMDYERLRRIVLDPAARANLARRLGTDEQTLAQHASVFFKQREVERVLSELPPDELRRVLTDRELLKKYADRLGLTEEGLMVRIEEVLQQRAPPKEPPIHPPAVPKPEARPPPVERRFMHQRREPETGGVEVSTKDGQILIVKNREEAVKPAVRDVVEVKDLDVQMPKPAVRDKDAVGQRRRVKDVEVGGARTTRVQDRDAVRADDVAAGRTDQPTAGRTDQPVVGRTSDVAVVGVGGGAVVVTERELVRFVPYLPPALLSMPVAVALPAAVRIISQIVGAPVSLKLPPPPSGSMPLGAYLRSILPRGGWGGAQREVYVLL